MDISFGPHLAVLALQQVSHSVNFGLNRQVQMGLAPQGMPFQCSALSLDVAVHSPQWFSVDVEGESDSRWWSYVGK